MKAIVSAFILFTSIVSFAESERTLILKGEKAEALMGAFAVLTEGGTKKVDGIEVSTGETQESDKDNVVDQWVITNGRIGSRTYECESHKYLILEPASESNIEKYKNFTACRRVK